MFTRLVRSPRRLPVNSVRNKSTKHQINIEPYIRLTIKTILDTIHPVIIYWSVTPRIDIRCEVKYKDLVITHKHKNAEICEMIKNFTLPELRELLIAFASETLIMSSDKNNTATINTIEKMKFAIDILTKTIEMQETQESQEMKEEIKSMIDAVEKMKFDIGTLIKTIEMQESQEIQEEIKSMDEINTSIFLGMRINAANNKAGYLYGGSIRECEQDGNHLIEAKDMQMNRLNVGTTNGLITKIYGFY